LRPGSIERPPAVLWHSLWVDSRSWGPLVDAFAAHRCVVTIDGPGYGRSSPIRRDFTLDECAQTAGEVLDQLGITEPVDWVGNARAGTWASPWRSANHTGCAAW
jgi:pimeloyl-ACP methyl ester carboxylesterase